jgi:PAS domain S-box-containing protein
MLMGPDPGMVGGEEHMAGTDEVHALAEAILEAADVAGLGVTVSYDDGVAPRHVFVNDAAAQILDYQVEELVGHPTSIAFAPEERGLLSRLCERSRNGEAVGNLVETVGLRKTGERVPIEAAFSVVPLAGEPAIVVFLRDIRERKQIQTRLAFADRMATLGMLAAGVAHEINNPLAYATLGVEGLARQLEKLHLDPSSESAESLASAREGLARVATIVRDLLSLSNPASEQRWPVDVESVLESAVNIAMHTLRGRTRLVRRYDDVPPLKTDPARLGQVLLNLLFNAAQSFQGRDERANEISLEIAAPEPLHVAITIGDNGSGIPTQDLHRIFEPFYTTKPAGTGLGLAICQNLVTSLGGRLEVESVVGRGSRFTVRLPAPGAP